MLGALIVIAPFAAVRIAVMVFGAALVADGISDLATIILEKRAASAASGGPAL